MVPVNGVKRTFTFHSVQLSLSSSCQWYLIRVRYPCQGLVNPSCTGLIRSGLVVHLPSLFNKIDSLESQGNRILCLDAEGHYIQVFTVKALRLFISDRAHLVFDFHQTVDGLKEVELGGSG